ncbi:MAG: mercuric reductase [Planctomycetes bacterium]|nr:mercuric reductase [Planctomycetota bacterium]
MEHQPADVHNLELLRHVRPPDWRNPRPRDRYDLVVVGAGTAGLVTAAGASSLGARVALVERFHMGGDCLNAGCVPSKALLATARAVAGIRACGKFGIEAPPGARVNFEAVMERMRRLRTDISPNDSADRFRGLGVDVFFGEASFKGPGSILVAGAELPFRKAVIASGTRPAVPPIPGLAEAGFLTNETVFNRTELPRRLAVIGAGPIGCELAQAFARFGSEVTLIGSRPHVLPREDPDAAAFVHAALVQDGVRILTPATTERIEKSAGSVLHMAGEAIHADAILVAAGRVPNVEGLNLAVAGVTHDGKLGVHVNDRLQTSNRRIFAAGDICSAYKFTHAADAMARLVVQNALFPTKGKMSRLIIPWCTYTDPEVAHVGLHEGEAKERGIAVTTFNQELRHVDRAILDGETEGFVRVHVRRGTDKLVGATVVARHAGDMIAELTLAMTAGLGLKTLGRTIHPYPTQAEAIRKTADAYARTRLTPFMHWLLSKWIRWFS